MTKHQPYLLACAALLFAANASALPQAPPRLAWVARYTGPANNTDTASAIATDRLGNVVVTGSSRGTGGAFDTDFATVKYDARGNQLWARRYTSGGNSSDDAYALALDGAGNVLVTGTAIGRYLTIKYDASGNVLWQRTYRGPGPGSQYDIAYALALDTSGNVYVTGRSAGLNGYPDYATVKYDPDGNQVWVARYSFGNVDVARAIALDAAGNVYVTGYSDPPSGSSTDYATVKYDASGNQIWAARYNGNRDDYPTAIVLDAAGNAYVTGASRSFGFDYATVKYDPDGNQLWVRRYVNPTGNFSDSTPTALVLDASGNLYVTGGSQHSGTEYDYATLKYDALGNQLWVRRYKSGPRLDSGARAIALDRRGNVVVIGESNSGPGSGNDIVTIGYDAWGNQQWLLRYNGPGNGGDGASALSIDALGNVYVTGGSTGAGTGSDFVTLKYAPRLPLINNPTGVE